MSWSVQVAPVVVLHDQLEVCAWRAPPRWLDELADLCVRAWQLDPDKQPSACAEVLFDVHTCVDVEEDNLVGAGISRNCDERARNNAPQ